MNPFSAAYATARVAHLLDDGSWATLSDLDRSG
jgi:hypothetical protein